MLREIRRLPRERESIPLSAPYSALLIALLGGVILFLNFRDHLQFIPTWYLLLSEKRILAVVAVCVALTLPAFFLVRSGILLSVLFLLNLIIPLVSYSQFVETRPAPSLEAKGIRAVASNNPYLDRIDEIRAIKAKSASADALWSKLAERFLSHIDRHDPAHREQVVTGAMLIVSAFYDYGNADLRNKRRPGCALVNEQTDFKPVDASFAAYRDAQIGCCTDFALMLASFLSWLDVENMFVTMPGHIANKVRIDGEWLYVDANTNTVIDGLFAPRASTSHIRITYFPHPNNSSKIGRYDIYNFQNWLIRTVSNPYSLYMAALETSSTKAALEGLSR
ncbi:hypothetical protein [Hyphomicrobium sp.]|uniref:hypothetical protein n=1 Tax=Hyphomicrobium sp. TaxID=82 RepID=UPI003D14B233